MIKDIIRLKWEAELPHEQIAAALAVSKGVVTKYVGLAAAAGLDWETVREWDGAEVFRALERTKAAGGLLLHLGHADGALAQVVGKRHAQIRHETQHFGRMLAHAAKQVERRGLLDPAPALAVSGRLRMAGLSFLQKRLVVRKYAPYLPDTQRRSVAPSRRLTAPSLLRPVASANTRYWPRATSNFPAEKLFTFTPC